MADTTHLIEALKAARHALSHDECWSTGPLTGDVYEDLVVCPGCRAINKIDEALALAMPAANRSTFIIVTNNNDWEGLYIDRKLVDQGHEIPRETLLKHLGLAVEEMSAHIDDCLPDLLEDVILL